MRKGSVEMNEHRGIAESEGIRYTYEHAEAAPQSGEDYYRVSTLIRYVEVPIHVNRYYVPADKLDGFLSDVAVVAEEVWDVRPVSEAQAEAELRAHLRDPGSTSEDS
jgi:hypothetical protein